MRRNLILLVAAAALATATAGLAATAADRYNDPPGDSGGAPDVTEVQIGNDVVKGPVVVWATTGNRTALAADDAVGVFVDSDLNPGTGAADFGGADFGITADSSGARLHRWDGADFAQVPAATLRSTWVASERALRIEIHPSELGGTRGFNFYVVTVNGEAGGVAPDGSSLYTYTLASGPLVLTKERAAASTPRAGRPFVLGLMVGREDLDELLGEGRVRCTLKLGTATLRSTVNRFVEDIASCGWRLPRTAKGKRLRATITVTYGGASVSHSHTAVVRR